MLNSNPITGALCLGEIGRTVDLSGINKIVDSISSLFNATNEDVKTAGSICLGNVAIGNPEFFLKNVFKLLD
jgi:hypothetical protein